MHTAAGGSGSTEHLTLHITTALATTTVTAHGEIDMATRDHLRQTVTEACGRTPEVRLVLRDVSFVDSTGVNTLVLLHRQLTEQGRHLVIASPSTAVLQVLGYTGAQAILDIEVGEP